MTKDRRILIRNTAEVYNPYQMSQSELNKRSIKQKIGIKKLAYGILAMSKNISFDKYLLPSLFFIFLSIVSIILRKFGIKRRAI